MYLIIFFLLGIFLGSLYNQIGRKLPKKETIFTKDKCNQCGYLSKWYEHCHLFQYFLRSGRCKKCGKRLDFIKALNELFTGLLFALAYYTFGFSYELLIALGIISLLIIVLISDITHMIIPDEVLIFFNAYFIIILVFDIGLMDTMVRILSGVLLFIIMYLIMILGNAIIKGESLGGGDVKMMFTFGLLLGPIVGIFSIFLSSLIALPISILIILKKNEHVIPFGPFLLISLLFLYFTGVEGKDIIHLLDFI